MRILADENVPQEFVSAVRGDGHEAHYSRDLEPLGPETGDDAATEYADARGLAVLSTDVKDFAGRATSVPVFVAPQATSGGAFRAAVARIEELAFDAAGTDPSWLSSL